MKVIEDSGKKMLHMIDMSLDMFKMETGKYEYSPVRIDAVGIAEDVIAHSSSKISANKVKIELVLNGTPSVKGDHLFVMGEERLFYSLLSGLISNAIDASPVGEVICIAFTDSSPAVISISNKGTVPDHIRKSFFQKYVTSGKSSGTGLGTYSAKLMADTMNYDISMETSDANNETCIKVFIPHERKEQ